jgi:hypothetical protein
VNNKFYNINWCNFNDKYKIAELDLEWLIMFLSG